MRTVQATVLGALAALTLAPIAFAKDVAVARDGERVLVSKTQNGEDWLVTWDQGRETVSGSVKTLAGQSILIDCDVLSSTGDSVSVNCFSAEGSGWVGIGQTFVTKEFLLGGTPGPVAPPPSGSCPEDFWNERLLGQIRHNCIWIEGQDWRWTSVNLEQSGCKVSGVVTDVEVGRVRSVYGRINATATHEGLAGTMVLGGDCEGTLTLSSVVEDGQETMFFDGAVSCIEDDKRCSYISGDMIVGPEE